jgi:hypothetical protein
MLFVHEQKHVFATRGRKKQTVSRREEAQARAKPHNFNPKPRLLLLHS